MKNHLLTQDVQHRWTHLQSCSRRMQVVARSEILTRVLRVDDVFEAWKAMTCWRARRGHGSFLTFDFGEVLPDGRAAWHLWVYFGDWQLLHGDRVLATGDDEYEAIEHAVESFNGACIVEVQESETGTLFDFGGGRKLVVGPNSDDEIPDAERWLLFTPDEMVLVAPGPIGPLSYRRSDEP